MIVRKQQQFIWDCISLNQLQEDIGRERTLDIPDDSQNPLVILMAIETYQETLNQLNKEIKDND